MVAREKVSSEERNAAFAKRLNDAANAHPLIPPKEYGRYPYIKEILESRFKVDVSAETVRKWFVGYSMPRPRLIPHLSQIFDVDEGWLAFGNEAVHTPSQRRTRDAAVRGGVNVVVGLLQLAGISCAFPSNDDPNRTEIDFYSIIGGEQIMVGVTVALDITDGQTVLTFPSSYSRRANIVLIPKSETSVDLFVMPKELIETSENVGLERKVTASHTGSSLVVGKKKISRADNLTQRLLAV